MPTKMSGTRRERRSAGAIALAVRSPIAVSCWLSVEPGLEHLPGGDELEAHVAKFDHVARVDESTSQLGAVHVHAVRRALVENLEATIAEIVILQ